VTSGEPGTHDPFRRRFLYQKTRIDNRKPQEAFPRIETQKIVVLEPLTDSEVSESARFCSDFAADRGLPRLLRRVMREARRAA
jgi:hypothetical protein